MERAFEVIVVFLIVVGFVCLLSNIYTTYHPSSNPSSNPPWDPAWQPFSYFQNDQSSLSTSIPLTPDVNKIERTLTHCVPPALVDLLSCLRYDNQYAPDVNERMKLLKGDTTLWTRCPASSGCSYWDQPVSYVFDNSWLVPDIWVIRFQFSDSSNPSPCCLSGRAGRWTLTKGTC